MFGIRNLQNKQMGRQCSVLIVQDQVSMKMIE